MQAAVEHRQERVDGVGPEGGVVVGPQPQQHRAGAKGGHNPPEEHLPLESENGFLINILAN